MITWDWELQSPEVSERGVEPNYKKRKKELVIHILHFLNTKTNFLAKYY